MGATASGCTPLQTQTSCPSAVDHRELQNDEAVTLDVDQNAPLENAIKELSAVDSDISSTSSGRAWSSEAIDRRARQNVGGGMRVCSASAKKNAKGRQAKQAGMFATVPANSKPSFDALDRFHRGGQTVAAAVRLNRLFRVEPAKDVPPVRCAISLATLNSFAARAIEMLGDELTSATVRTVTQALILPSCEQSGKAYARVLNEDRPCDPNVFVCHAWDENFSEFVASVNQAFKDRDIEPRLWISAFALLQTRRRTPMTRPDNAPFAVVLKSTEHMLVVHNRQVDIYTRLWPLWEMYLASKFGLGDKPSGFIPIGPRPQRVRSAPVDVLKAEVYDGGDKSTLHEAICGEEGGPDRVNRLLQEVRARLCN